MPNIVVNSTPIISLSIIGKLHLLKDIYGSIIIPEAVFEEISVKPDSVAKNELDKSLDWIQVRRIRNDMAKIFYYIDSKVIEYCLNEVGE